ncbi:MAG: endopeptidase La [Gammaproteobacteria bacterium]|nr:endopeptidase La [Gammaproteobacteria bacterium]
MENELHPEEFPVLPLRDVVVFPHMVIPLFVGRKRSIEALELATSNDKQILLVAQKEADQENPNEKQIYDVGCLANILQLLKLPDGNVKVLVEGIERVKVTKYNLKKRVITADAVGIESSQAFDKDTMAITKSLLGSFESYVKLNNKIPQEILSSLSGIEEPGRLTDTIAAHLPLKVDSKQEVLEMTDINQRLEHMMGLLDGEMDVIQIEKKVRGRVKKQMEKNQREYYLNEQMKAIQKELGETDEGVSEFDELENKIKSVGMPKEARDKTDSELKKLKMMSPMSAEATVVRSYIDWMISIPWKKKSKVRKDLAAAEKILDEDHYGLAKVKERILEYLAVQQRVNKLRGPILCLVGPPGVGKTSLGKSIAKSIGRKFVRMSLGGVRDEAEIRGHRRTYVGSLPGKIVQKMSKVGVKNPMFLLDEIDKMTSDMRGDPASAMLEVLDPEQNHSFNDHYLEIDYDLSDVMFVATANSMNIPAPLLDRMEVIRLSGYTEQEKLNIAAKYLLPKQLELNGLLEGELEISRNTLLDVIRYYTKEAGVRSLEREIAKLCRKSIKTILLANKKNKDKITSIRITPKQLESYLGVRRFDYGVASERAQVGQVTGLAWTEFGGEILTIESAITPGKGKTITTGSLGDVMTESIQAAMTVVRARAASLGLDDTFHEKIDVHVHVPEGATPKDGPSAGIGMCTALVSSLTKIPVSPEVAMTGEITLRGEVLPIGGLKEKLLAAHRGGITKVIIPKQNEKDLDEIPANVKAKLEIIPVQWVDQVLEVALTEQPVPKISDVALAETSNNATGKKSKDVKPH